MATGWSTTGISAAMTMAFVALAVGSIAWGALSDRVGPCPVVLDGSLLLPAGLALAGLDASLVFGLLGCRFGAARVVVLVLVLLARAMVALGCAATRQLGRLYAVAALLGFTWAGAMPLFAAIARKPFPLRMMGTVIAATTMASSLAMALGPVAGGLICDTFSSCAWLFVGTFALGSSAFQAALAFTRLPRRRVAPSLA